MAIKGKLIIFDKYSQYKILSEGGNIPLQAIVFIKDTGLIITHATDFGGNIKDKDNSSVTVSLAGVSKDISLAGHTHPYLPLAGGTITNLITFTPAGNARAVLSGVSSDKDYIHLYVTDSTRPLVFQNGYGNVGIGVIAPTLKLEVSGNIKASGALYSGTKKASLEGHKHNAEDITEGVLNIARLPHGALERLKIVKDDAERFKLTTASVQKGDTVKVSDTGRMYFIVDDTKLTTEEGYVVYTAGSATSVPWSGITEKPDLLLSSDIADWAKAKTKPSYTAEEVKAVPLAGGTITGNLTVNGTISSGSYIKPEYDTSTGGIKFKDTHLTSLENLLLWLSGEAIRFGSSDWNWDKWAGLKYDPNSKTIYLGLADGTIFTKNASVLKDGKLSLVGISEIMAGDKKVSLDGHTHNYLPLSGGTLTNAGFAGLLNIYRSANAYSVILFSNNTTKNAKQTLGYLGFTTGGTPIYRTAANVDYTIYHTGNLTPSNYVPIAGTPTSKPMTGSIWFNNVDGIKINSHNTDRKIWEVVGNAGSFASQFGFHELYKGASSGNDNSLKLYAHDTTGTHINVRTISQKGIINFHTKPVFEKGLAITDCPSNNDMPYFLGIDAFSSGGTVKYVSASSAKVGHATTASKLSTVSKTAWGKTFWTDGGIPESISGDMTNVGSITFSTLTGTNSRNLLYQVMGDNDLFRLKCGATATNEGYVEFATSDDGTEPIYFRQYTGVFTTLKRTLTLLDGSGNTSAPGSISAVGGFKKGTLGDTYVLKAGGGAELESSLSVGSAASMSSWNVADSNDETKRRIWMSYKDNGGKPCYSDKLTFQNSTNTLFVNDKAVLTAHQSLANYVTLDSTQTISGSKTFSSSIKSSYTSSTWINSVSNAALNCTHTSYGGIFNAKVNSGRIAMSTYPASDNNVYIGYASNDLITTNTNSFNRETHWDAATGIWYADGFKKKDGTSVSYEGHTHGDSYIHAKYGNASKSITIDWSGEYSNSDAPYLLGWNSSGSTIKAINRDKVSVNYATSAGSVARWSAGDSVNCEHNANNIVTNGVWYYNSNGPANLGNSTADGALYTQAYNSSWVGQIAQDYRNGNLFVRGKNNGTWKSWYKIWSSQNLTPSNYLLKAGGTLTGGLEILGTKSGSTYKTSTGFYHNGYNNLILRGDTTYGRSGILFTSSKGTTSINQTSDGAFIQFAPYGGTAASPGTSGEAAKLIIGIDNDADDLIYLQAPSIDGLKFCQPNGNVYKVWHAGNFDPGNYQASGHYVTTDTVQAISGKKTFNTDIVIPNGHYLYGQDESGGAMVFFNGTNTVLGSIGSYSTKATHIRSKTGHVTVGTSNNALYTIWDSGNLVKVPKTTAVVHTNWENDQDLIIDKRFLSYWNGAYTSTGSSNLTFCTKGRFGSIITKDSGDYLPIGGGLLTGRLTIKGNAASIPLVTRNVVGSNGDGAVGDLYLQYGVNNPIYLGKSGAYNISEDGSKYSGDAATVSGGYTVAKNVPKDAVFTDTIYTHPPTHPATMIVEDALHLFVTDAEKGKLELLDMAAIYKFTELDDLEIQGGLIVNSAEGWNSYTFEEAFLTPPVVTCTPEEDYISISVKNITTTGFLYCVYHYTSNSASLASSGIKFNYIAISKNN